MKVKESHLIEVLEDLLLTKDNVNTDDEAIVFDTKISWLIKQLEDIQSSTSIQYSYNKIKRKREREMERGR